MAIPLAKDCKADGSQTYGELCIKCGKCGRLFDRNGYPVRWSKAERQK